MKQHRVAFLIAALILSLGVALSQQASQPPPRAGEPQDLRLLPKDPNGGIRRFLEMRTYGGKKIPPGAYERAKGQWQKLRTVPSLETGTFSGTESFSSVSGVIWKPIGPTPMRSGGSDFNGRVNAIAVHPYNPNVIYLGASGGGVWSSKDGGATWTPWTDHQPMIAIGEPNALAIDPSDTNVVYVGTSTAVNNTTGAQGNQLNITQGIMKSTDGGASWIILGSGFPAGNDGNASQFRGRDIYAIIVDPANSNWLYLASSSGLYWSIDGGQNWTLGTNGAGVAQSLELDASSPTNARVLFAGVRGSGIRRSLNGGQSWTQVLSTATTSLANALAVHDTMTSTAGINKVAVALAPPTMPPNASGVQVIYATIEGVGGDFVPTPYTPILGIFQSTDQGTTWNLRSANAPASLQCQCFYTNTIAVDPASPGDGLTDTVYWGGTSTFRSDDGGATFSNITNGIHVDSHSWGFGPQGSGQPSIVFAGNDGGIFKSTDKGATWTGTGAGPATINAGGLQITQMYHMDIKRDATASVTLAALQDNGTIQWTGSPQWDMTAGGDGLDVVFARATEDDAFAINNGGPNHSGDSGGSWGGISGDLPADQIQIFNNTMNVDPNDTDVLYFSGAATNNAMTMTMIPGQLFQTMNGGGNWRNITQFTAIQTVGPSAVAPANSNNVAVAVGSSVYVSTNALAGTVGPPSGVTFANITRNLPNRAVTRIVFDPIDPTVIYVTLSGFGGGHLFRTTIGGSAWRDLSPPLDVPFNGIAIDGSTTPTRLYVGTDLGAIRSVDGGNSWTALDTIHFPNAPVTDLQVNEDAGVLRVSTFGRGAFELSPATGPVIAINAEDGLDFGTICSGETRRLTIQVFNVGTEDLVIDSVQRVLGSMDFTVLPNPSTPVVISPDAEVDFTVEFSPTTTSGTDSALIRVSSSDPGSPYFDILATAVLGNADITTIIADSGSYGDVCLGTFADLDLTINNGGECDLRVNNISSSSSQFHSAGVLSYPLLVAPGASVAVPIRFEPTTFGAKVGTITVSSNDPGSPSMVGVSGNAPPGEVRVTGSGEFGDVCADDLAEKAISVCDVGACDLGVSSASIDCADFTLINNPFPATVSEDFCIDLTVQFTPTSAGPKSCTLTIHTDDPLHPTVVVPLTGNTPLPMIDVPPDLGFAPEVLQDVGVCESQLPFPVSNTGTCPLTLTNFEVSTNPAEYSLAALPSFPIILEPGHIAGEGDLSVVFGPEVLDRARQGQVSVEYVSEPILGTLTTVTRDLCGEGARTGARVLVTHGGVPLPEVKAIKLHRLGPNRNQDRLDTVDNVHAVLLQTETPPPPCGPFFYHREYGTVSNPIQLSPGSYQVSVMVRIDGQNLQKTVGFDVTSCDFNPTIVVDF